MSYVKNKVLGWSQNGGGIRLGDHFLPHKYIKRSSACGVMSTEQFLNTDGGPQIIEKANQSLWNELGQRKKMERETKNFRTEIHPGEGAVKEKFLYNRKSSYRLGQWGI